MFPRIWAWPSLEQRAHCMDVCDVNTKAKKGGKFCKKSGMGSNQKPRS